MKKILTYLCFIFVVHNVAAQGCIENTSCITFDGLNSYAIPANQTNLNITDSITVEAWINPASFAFNSANNSIVCKHGWSSGEGGFVLRCGGSGELSFNIGGLDPNQNPVSWKEVLSPTNALTLNTWIHVAGSYDGQNVKLFINGVEQNSTPFTGSIVPSPNYPLTIGRLSDPIQFPSRYFDGKIDEVRIWNRAVPAAELMANMNKHIDPATANKLVSYWRFNENTGSTSVDLKSVNDLTLNSNTWDTLVPFNITYPVAPVITYNLGILSSNANGQWNLNGTPIPNQTGLNFQPLVNGDYSFTTAPNQYGCTSTSNIITVNDVSVAELNNNLHVTVVPNPMVEEATIVINSNMNYPQTSLVIYDLEGRKVYSENTALKQGLNQIRITKNSLTQGLYFYEFVSRSQTLTKGKFTVR